MVQSLGLALDPRSGTSLYQQIFDQVVTRIRSGAFPAGFRLPPTRTLASALRTNRNTVVRAYEDLLAAGFVDSTVGRGTFVADARLKTTTLLREGDGERATLGTSGMPWSTLLARPVFAEPLSRIERLQRSIGPMSTDAINLARLEPSADLIPNELLRRCSEHVLRSSGGKAFRYSNRDGTPRLRGLIAEDLARQGVPAAADDIIVTSGSQQAIDLVVRALVNPGDPFLVDEWTYAGALNILSATGARLVAVPADDEGPSLSALERVSHIGAKGFYLMPNSQNPTGASISARRRETLIEWSRRSGVPLIEDDYVADLNLDGSSAPVALRALDGDVIYLGSFSKRLAPGLRVGFMVVPPAFRQKLMLLKHAADSGSSEFLQDVLSEFLERGYLDAHLSRSIPEYRSRRDALEAGLKRHLPPQITWRRPERGLSLWLSLPPSVSPQELFEQAQRKGVIVQPSSLNAVEDRDEGGLRLAYCGEPEARLLEGARRLGRAVSALVGRGRRGESVPTLGGI